MTDVPQPRYIASLSYGKDSLAMLEAIHRLNLPLTDITTCDVWFDKDTPADIPELYEFKQRMDKVILERYGIKVNHVSNLQGSRFTTFYDGVLSKSKSSKYHNNPCEGFPGMKMMHWCNSMKREPLDLYARQTRGSMNYIGFAADESERATRYKRNSDKRNKKVRFPLIEIGWTEAECMQWCKDNDMLSPVYTMGRKRDGCWFCPLQGITGYRWIYHTYPELWTKLLTLDQELAASEYRATEYEIRHSIMQYDQRFKMEDEGLLNEDDRAFKWNMLDGEYQLKIKF